MQANIFYIILLTLFLIILGGSYPKIALAIAGLIFLGAILFNVDNLKELIP